MLAMLGQCARMCVVGAFLTLGACAEEAPHSPGEPTPSVNGIETVKSSIARNEDPQVSSALISELVAGNQAFAFDLYHWLTEQKPEENLFYSPHSIIQAMGMVSAGAKQTTLAQFDEVFYRQGFEGHSWHEALNRLSLDVMRGNASDAASNPFTLTINNSIWGLADYPYLNSFLDLLAEHYGAGLNIVDFVSNPEGARERINAWVALQTNDMIKALLPPGSITPLTRLVLTNTIYFKADWYSQFDPDYTYEGDFHGISGQSARVNFMSQKASFPYAQVDGHQIIELPYKGERQSMVLVLPDEAADFRTFEQNLDEAQWGRYLSGLSHQTGQVTLPRFKMNSGTSLKEAFTALGLEDAFSEAADFSGIAANNSLSISDILHQGVVIVDEKGTEAAAATAVIVTDTSMPMDFFFMTLNRPFVFAIRDRSNGELLFVGRYVVAAENP